jgi:hypothetical protein
MPISKHLALRTALTAAALGFLLAAKAVPTASAAAAAEMHYGTRCAVVDTYFADAYITNFSMDTYEVRGEVQMKFPYARSIDIPRISAQANAVIHGGETVRLVHVRMPFQAGAGERCELDVSGVIRRI